MRFVSNYPADTVASVQRLAKTTTLPLSVIARQMDIPYGTVTSWSSRKKWRPSKAGTPPEGTAPDPASERARPLSEAQVRRSYRQAIAGIAEEARRQMANLRDCPPKDAAERDRHARTLASYVRTLRQCDDLLAQAEPARRPAKPKGDPHDGEGRVEQGRSLAELRDEFVRLLARAVADEPDRGGPRPL